MEKLYISRDGLEKLNADLKEMLKRRLVVAAAIEHARSLGDLKENAEYHSAKEEQGMLHARIADTEDKISRAAILEDQDIDTSKAYMGATVKLLNKKTNREITYILVSHVEADMANGKISTVSPVGKAILGKAIGEEAVATIPAGELRLKVLDITY